MVASAHACLILDEVEKNNRSLKSWAKIYLSRRHCANLSGTKELIVPFVAHGHWSLFVFQEKAVYYFDSISRYHFPGKKSEYFVKQVIDRWKMLLGDHTRISLVDARDVQEILVY